MRQLIARPSIRQYRMAPDGPWKSDAHAFTCWHENCWLHITAPEKRDQQEDPEMPATESQYPFWFPGKDSARQHPRLDRDLDVDVAVVGGGIVGLSAAHRLLAAGRKVAVLEARQIGRQATGRSTAKVTSQHGRRYKKLIDDIGRDNATLYAAANQRAIGTIRRLCDSLKLDCGLQTKPAFVFAETEIEASSLREEADAAIDLGLPASFVTDVALPLPVAGALRFDDQAQFDPFRYLTGLAEEVITNGLLFENTRVTAIEHGEPCQVEAGGHTVTADHVIVSTQMPIVADGLYFAKAFPVAHPLAAAPLPDTALADGMFISASSPTHSFRTAENDGTTYLVAAGGAFKTGVSEEQAAMIEDLRRFLRAVFRIDRLSHLWVNEDFRPMDGLPFVGPVSSSKHNLLVATGFDSWGITQGTAAAEILADSILQRANRAAAIFDAGRLRPVAGGRELITENLKAGAHLLSGRLLGRQVQRFEDIPENQGGIVELEGEQVAVIRDGQGIATALSAACTHLGCIVGWNGVDRTWDCPCHGSRFDVDGKVISGPAVAALEPKKVKSAPGKAPELRR
jgi:glycine/D-amino acid oxidase-like deaminating enzyme/nitrite reductase/ring-hydroxylating ferredoxin subunit